MSKKSSAAYTSARREFRNLYPATAPVVEAPKPTKKKRRYYPKKK